jgi:hypothetical protein
MCSFKVPITIFVHLEKSGRQLLWDNKKDSKCMENWDLVCRPEYEGGVEVLNLRIQNQPLLKKKPAQIL